MSFLPISAYETPTTPYYVSQGQSISIPPTQNMLMGWQNSSISGTLSFATDQAGDLRENLSIQSVRVPGTGGPAKKLGLTNTQSRWTDITVGSVNVAGDVVQGTEVISQVSADGMGNLLMGTIKPVAIRDYSGVVGTASQVLTVADASGHLLWVSPAGGSTQIRAGQGTFGLDGSVSVPFTSAMSDNPVVVMTYIGAGFTTMPCITGQTVNGFTAVGQSATTFNWIATLIQ